MDTATLMAQFANPETIKTLSIGQQLTGGMITTLLGMGITFICLGILQFTIGLFEKLADKPAAQPQQMPPVNAAPEHPAETLVHDEELVAAITAALTMTLNTTTGQIVIRNIRRTEDYATPWNRVGRVEQMIGNG
jgi:glutaconyl-CoA/methylmalonyl-CoA decarboxylase subunit delta